MRDPAPREDGHILHACNEPGCTVCEGGLTFCNTCRGTESCLPSMCPQRKMTSLEDEMVTAGMLDFLRLRSGLVVGAAITNGLEGPVFRLAPADITVDSLLAAGNRFDPFLLQSDPMEAGLFLPRLPLAVDAFGDRLVVTFNDDGVKRCAEFVDIGKTAGPVVLSAALVRRFRLPETAVSVRYTSNGDLFCWNFTDGTVQKPMRIAEKAPLPGPASQPGPQP